MKSLDPRKHNDMYYEGKERSIYIFRPLFLLQRASLPLILDVFFEEYETKMLTKRPLEGRLESEPLGRPGQLTAALREALGMEDGAPP